MCIHKTLKLLCKEKDYGVRLVESYNKIAEDIGMPSVPPLSLDKSRNCNKLTGKSFKNYNFSIFNSSRTFSLFVLMTFTSF